MNMRESSKQNWTSNNTIEQINAGSFQRIADACEVMAKNYAALIAERDRWKSRGNYWRGQAEYASRRVSALKGQITKLKNQRARALLAAVGGGK